MDRIEILNKMINEIENSNLYCKLIGIKVDNETYIDFCSRVIGSVKYLETNSIGMPTEYRGTPILRDDDVHGISYILEVPEYETKDIIQYFNNKEKFLIKQIDEIERLNNSIERINSIYRSMQFSAPENQYIFINKLGEVLKELKGDDKE